MAEWLQEPPPKPSRYRTVNVPVALWAEVLVRAANAGMSPGRYVRSVLVAHFASNSTPPEPFGNFSKEDNNEG